jgi:hypothetical protein
VEEADKDAPGGIGREVAESTATSAEFGWGDKLILPWQVSLYLEEGGRCFLMRKLDPKVKTSSLRQYIEREDWEDILSKI